MKPLPLEQWDPCLQPVIDDMGGQPINIHRLLANHPPLLQAWWQFRMYSVRGGDLDQRDCELVILRVAVHTKTWYEWAAHVDRGLAAGLTLDEINRVAENPANADWSARDRLLLQGVDQLLCNYRIDAPLRNELATFFSEQQILDIISLQGLYVSLAGMISTWGVEIEPSIAARLPASVTEAAFKALISTPNRN